MFSTISAPMNKPASAAIVCLLLASSSFSQVERSAVLLDSSKICLVNQHYDRAETVLHRLLKTDPDNSEATYLLIATAQTKMLDYESYTVDADGFIDQANAALATLTRVLPTKRGPDSLRCLFYIGNIQGGISVIDAKVGNWPSAVESGANSIGAFKRVIKANPDFYPAYLGLGIFNYYISQNLKWLPFFQDRRKEGLEQIRLSTRAEFPYSYVAKNSLCWILMEQNEFHEADSIASSVLAELPANTIFIRLKARIAYWQKDLPGAITWARKLVVISEKRVPVNWSDLLSGYQILIGSYDDLKKKNECKMLCRRALSRTIPGPYLRIPYVKKFLAYIADIQKKYAD